MIFRSQKGFTLIGVLVASSLGLIVAAALTQMFVNMQSQIKQMEQKSRMIFFNESLGSILRSGCNESLGHLSYRIAQGLGGDKFQELKDYNGRVALDLHAEKARLKSEYGIDGHNYFELNCVNDHDNDPNTGYFCNCVTNTPNPNPCQRKWALSFFSMRKVKGAPVYDRGAVFELNIRYDDHVLLSESDTSLPRHHSQLRCDNTITMAANPNATLSGDCVHIDKNNNISLIGCGTTKDINQSTVTAYGYNAGHIGTGQYNTFIGYEAGQVTTGGANLFVGYEAGQANTTGGNNIFMGHLAGQNNTAGNFNLFVGDQAGRLNTTASDNHFVGYQAGYSNTTGTGNYFSGYRAGPANTASNNHFVGYKAGEANTTGAGNYFAGFRAGQKNTTASNNHFVGYQAGTANIAGTGNYFSGFEAGLANTASNNHFVGFEAGKSNTTGAGNYFAGFRAGQKNTTALNNHFVGFEAGKANTTGAGNYFAGFRAGQKNTTASNNHFVGFEAGKANIAGTGNYFSGFEAGLVNTASNNHFEGFEAGKANTTGAGNYFAGFRAGQKNTTASNNHFVGYQAGTANIAGTGNYFTGYKAGAANTASYNHFAGYEAGKANTTGAGNYFSGSQAGVSNTTGSHNVYIGGAAGASNNGSNNVFIGSNAATLESGVNNKFIVGNNTNTKWIESTIVASPPSNPVFTVGGKQVAYDGHTHILSSRTLKKNIEPFINFDQALDDILKTPLFSFQYKDKNSHPNKKRRGVIAEELPENLQLKTKPTQPDWPSIYGTLWAGLKALHKKMTGLEKAFSLKLEALESRLKDFVSESAFKKLARGFENLKRDLSARQKAIASSVQSLKTDLLSKIQSLSSRLEKLSRDFAGAKEKLAGHVQEFASFRADQSRANKQLKDLVESQSRQIEKIRAVGRQNQKALEEAKRELAGAKSELAELKSQLKSLKQPESGQ